MTDTITLPRSVVEQALEALDEIAWSNNTRRQSDRADDARIVLRAALEQPQAEQEPVTARHRFRNPQRGTPDWSVWQPCKVEKKRPVWEIDSQGFEVEYQALYTRPQPPRQPLTDAQINGHRLALPYDGEDLPDPWDFKQGVRAAERAHRIGGEA